jgi:hypothetical protein
MEPSPPHENKHTLSQGLLFPPTPRDHIRKTLTTAKGEAVTAVTTVTNVISLKCDKQLTKMTSDLLEVETSNKE